MNEPAIQFTETSFQPTEIQQREKQIADLCRDIVTATAQMIQGKKYVKVEGWQAIATAHGCIAGARDVRKVEGGYTAIGEIRRASDGMILSTAEGFCGSDERTWSKRPEYALRAMAQTRAISRACRSAFAHIVVMMQAGLETTPAEEIPHDAAHERQESHAKEYIMPIGKKAGQLLKEVDTDTLKQFIVYAKEKNVYTAQAGLAALEIDKRDKAAAVADTFDGMIVDDETPIPDSVPQ